MPDIYKSTLTFPKYLPQDGVLSLSSLFLSRGVRLEEVWGEEQGLLEGELLYIIWFLVAYV